MKKAPHRVAPGHLHFVTVITHKRIPLFHSHQLCQEFSAALTETRARFPFGLFAYVLLPDHFHLLLRPNDGNISSLMQKIKSLAARRIVQTLRENENHKILARLKRTKPERRSHSYQVFQDSFRDLELWSTWMIHQKIDYIHANPVNEGVAANVAAYRWSSWRAIYERNAEPTSIDPLPD